MSRVAPARAARPRCDAGGPQRAPACGHSSAALRPASALPDRRHARAYGGPHTASSYARAMTATLHSLRAPPLPAAQPAPAAAPHPAGGDRLFDDLRACALAALDEVVGGFLAQAPRALEQMAAA